VTYRIESLLSSRTFAAPQRVGRRLYFVSNLAGANSLYAMDFGGSVPEPLLPPDLALQNPTLLEGWPFYVFPGLGKIVVILDKDGDENYQPMVIPLDGGQPEPAFGGRLENHRVHLVRADAQRGVLYLTGDRRDQPLYESFRGDLGRGELTLLGGSPYFHVVSGVSSDHRRVVLVDAYTGGDHALFLWEEGKGERLLFGKPIDQRRPGETVPPNGIEHVEFVEQDRAVLVRTSLFDDTYGVARLPLDDPDSIEPIPVTGTAHQGSGELASLDHLEGNRFRLLYNIDGADWAYLADYDPQARRMAAGPAILGQGELGQGVVAAHLLHYDRESRGFALAHSTATSPTQIFTLDPDVSPAQARHTRERVLGIPASALSPGEEAGFNSFDGLRVSARLYRPGLELGFQGPRPLVYYVHGGPQSQERPDFSWFSMPLIQFLTLHGFAVFVPNVRGSTGYGLSYARHVDRDWGGKDRLDHVYAMGLLAEDAAIDVRRAGVVGRSYGGYMSLTLAGRHPELWSAAVDMFGPYDLITFSQRIPPAWKPYFALALGDPEVDRDFLLGRSPRTHLQDLRCPLLVIQGKNDPRVVEAESRDLVEGLRAQGKHVEYLVFEDEGHDVLKFPNRVRCYNAITEFFVRHLRP
jgi:pimeloyl-ACP methyl ester carboxylesterase